jgi:predicted amidohydrolase YtcJ
MLVSMDDLDRMRETYARPDLKLDYAKLFLDGVAATHTASFLEPYMPRAGYDPARHDPDATLLLTPAVLNQTMTELDRRGYVVKTHAVGDNAARKTLDAIQAAREANGDSGLRHEIAHTSFVSDADLPRLAALDVVAEVSPKLWYPNAATPVQSAVLGPDRMARLHRIRSYQAHGAEVIFGTDWPAAAPDANPWTGLAGMLDRSDATGQYPGAINPDEAISLDAALPAFTTNAARAMGREGEVGQLKPGAWADFIVLPGDLTTLSPQEIGAITVRETVWKGKTVYEAGQRERPSRI